MEVTMAASGGIAYVEEEIMSYERMLKCLEKMKRRKAVRADEIKPEM